MRWSSRILWKDNASDAQKMGAGHKKRSDCSTCREVGRRDTQTWKRERNDKDGASNRGKDSIMSATDIRRKAWHKKRSD